MIGTPPARSSISGSAWEHFTSKTTFWPGPEALQQVEPVEQEERVAADDLAAVVDRADAVGVAVEGDAEVGAGLLHARDEVVEVRSTTGSGWWLGKVPSDSQ